MKNPINKIRSFSIDKKLSDRLDLFAINNNVSASWVIREALRRFILPKVKAGSDPVVK